VNSITEEKMAGMEKQGPAPGTFTIGQVSEITGISRDMLRYYEEKGILKPVQNYENNYREYSLSDIDIILSIEFYRSMDLGMKDINEIWYSDKPKKIQDLLENKEQELLAKIDEIQGCLKNIRKGQAACVKITENLNKFSLQTMPPFEVLGEVSDFRAYSEYGVIHNNKENIGGSIVSGLKRMITFTGKRIESSKMLITRELADGRKGTGVMEYGRCLYTLLEDSFEKGNLMEEMFDKCFYWAEKNNLKPKGMVIINMLLLTANVNSAKSYLEVFAPVE
jgi:DNA-binding transcriptional MerR regulator